MNANELADELKLVGEKIAKQEALGEQGFGIIFDSFTILRQFGLAESIIKQQQAEIGALKERLANYEGRVDT